MEDTSGGLALLFTDIEGSTELVRGLKSSYSLALRVHRRMLERCFEECRGTAIGSEGDSLFYVFPSAGLAVEAATAAQLRVEHYEWPEGRRLRVRMGIHTGSLTISGGEYVGLTVHEASRICDAAHGGQILCSAEVAAALDSSEVDDSLRDLGVYVLRGFPEGRHLFQVCADGLEQEFPLPRDSLRDGGVRVAMWFRHAPAVAPARAPAAATGELSFCTRSGNELDGTLQVEVVRTEPGLGNAFRLIVRANGTIEEEYDGLTVGGPTDAATVVNAHSRLIRIQG